MTGQDDFRTHERLSGDGAAGRGRLPRSRLVIAVLLVLLIGVSIVVGFLILAPSQRQATRADVATTAATGAASTNALAAAPAAASAAGGSGTAGVAVPASAASAPPPAAILAAAAAATTADAGAAAADNATPPANPAPAAAASPAGVPTNVEHIGDWFLLCPADGANKEKCVVQQQLRTPDNKQIVFVWTMHTDDKGLVHVVWQMPGGLDMRHGMLLDIGDGKPKTVPFSSCDSQSCAVAAQLVPEYLGKIEAATTISATVLPAAANAQPVRLGLSAKGLSDALSRLVPPPAS